MIAWGLSNYWNDGTAETDAVFEAGLGTLGYLEYTFEFVTKYLSFDVAIGVTGWDVVFFDNYFHIFVEDWSTCDKMQFSYSTLTLYFDINNLAI